MPDFDANDDPLRLTGAEQDEPLEPAYIRPRFQPRARALAMTSRSKSKLSESAPKGSAAHSP